jgi:hypothetical protein
MSEQACHIVCPHCTSINAATSVATRATVNGTVLVAVGEGIAVGIAYFVAGV